MQPAAKEKPASQMGMTELRETGMARPLTSDNKCATRYQMTRKTMHAA